MEATSSTTNISPDEAVVGQMCDVCARVVPEGEGVRAELSVAGAMCPSPMVFHQECYEQASELWQPDPESYCTVDPRFPETGQWTLPEDQQT